MKKEATGDSVVAAAIIPARGGKQSMPYKNLQKLGGKTLLEWAVVVANEATEIDVVVVSTEDARIARAAKKLGALVAPRPKKYAQPTSGDAGFYHHAVTWMEKEHGWKPEILVNLRPTGPLRFAADVDAMVAYLKAHPRVDGLKSVVPAPIHPYKMWKMKGKTPASAKATAGRQNSKLKTGATGKLTPVFDNAFRRLKGPDQPRQYIQEQWPVYWQDAQIDVTRRKFVLRPEALKHDTVWGPNLHGYVLDERSVVDIDTPEDLRQAGKVYRELRKEK